MNLLLAEVIKKGKLKEETNISENLSNETTIKSNNDLFNELKSKKKSVEDIEQEMLEDLKKEEDEKIRKKIEEEERKKLEEENEKEKIFLLNKKKLNEKELKKIKFNYGELESIFSNLSHNKKEITSQSLHQFYKQNYNKYDDILTPNIFEESIQSLQEFPHISSSCPSSTSSNKLDFASFKFFVLNFLSMLQSSPLEGKEIMDEIQKLSVDLSSNNPLIFNDIIDLPDFLNVDEIKEIMNEITLKE